MTVERYAMRVSVVTICLLLCCLKLSTGNCQEISQQENHVLQDQPFSWEDLPPIPDTIGLGGPIVGVHDNVLIVAGGANFPDGPPWPVGNNPPGAKKWHSQIYALPSPGGEWIEAGDLPYPLAYAATVSSDDGILVLGGETFDETNHATDRCLRLSWDAQTQRVLVLNDALPKLPIPSRYHAAVEVDGSIYVTASHAASETSATLDTKAFWRLSKSNPSSGNWEALETWPGSPREKMALVAQTSGAHPTLGSTPAIYMISGANWYRDADGNPDLSKYEHYADSFVYVPRTGQWNRIADLPAVDGKPRPAAAATALPLGQSHVVLFSGASGDTILLPGAEQPEFPKDVLAYHTITDTWVKAGEMLQGVVTTTAVTYQGKMVIPSGEIRPGIRTSRVQAATLSPVESSFNRLNMVVLVTYLGLVVGIGWWFSRREKGTDDYFLAGRKIPWWAAGISIYATQLSAITFLSLPAVSYSTNWLVFPGQMMILGFVPVVVFFYLPFFRRLNITTAYQYLELRFSRLVRYYGSLSFVTFQLGRMAVVVYLPALALETATGFPIVGCILLMGILATVYTVLGGMAAVIWTDVAQVVVLWGGIFLSIGICVLGIDDFGESFSRAVDAGKLTMFNWNPDPSMMATWVIVVGSFALQIGPYTTDQAVVQRYMTTKDEKAASKSIWLNGLLTIPFSFLFFGLGTAFYLFYQHSPDQLQLGMETDRVFPLFMTSQLPSGISGLVIAGVFAASMSSLDSSMHSIATVLTTDLFPETNGAGAETSETRLLIARIVTVVVGIVGTSLAVWLASMDIRSLFFFFQKILGLLGSGLAGVFILGIFTQRANAPGVLFGALTSFVIMCYVVFFTSVNFYLYAAVGIGAAVITGYLTSVVLPARNGDLKGLTWISLRETP